MELPAFLFAAPDYSESLQGTTGLGDQGMLAFLMVIVIEIDHDPIPGSSQIMGSGCVRVHSGEVPARLFRMQYG